MKHNTFIQLSRLLNWLNSYWFPYVPKVLPATAHYINHIIGLCNAHGMKYTIKRIKLYRLCVTKYMCKEPLRKVAMVIGLTKSGFPKQIIGLKPLIDSGDTYSARFVLTLLGISRALMERGEVDYSTITKPSYPNNHLLKEIEDFIPQFLEENNLYGYSGQWSRMDAHLSTKSGPQGLATWTAWKSAFLLPDHLIESIRIFGGQDIFNYITAIRNNYGFNKAKDNLFKALKFKDSNDLRKLSIVSDPELKERVIAILDWFSQEALRPFHTHLFELLRTMPQDRTFTQDPIIKDKQAGHSYHSLDLSAATDRFPIRLQQSLVSHLTNNEMGQAWKDIMTKLPFRTPEGDYIKYDVGQPMGAYSSWAVFTLSHHLVVKYAAHSLGYTKFSEYILLGDDIVIYHDAVAKRYVEVIQGIGAEISLMKSHSSSDTYEFAKRWFRNGLEISGIPVRGFLENIDKYHIIFMNVVNLYARGLHPARYSSIPDLIMALYRADLSLKSRFLKNLENRVTGLNAIHRYLHLEDIDTLRNYINLRVVGEFSLPTQEKDLKEFFIKLVRGSFDEMLADNTNRLSNYCNQLMDTIRLRAEGVADRTNGWVPSVIDYGQLPVVAGVFSKMKTTVNRLVTPYDFSDFKDAIKIVDFDDPSRITTVRSASRLYGSESRLIKHLFNSITIMAKGEMLPFNPAGQRSMIAMRQMQMVASLINPNNPMAKLRLEIPVHDWTPAGLDLGSI